jgi:hypothetical protein
MINERKIGENSVYRKLSKNYENYHTTNRLEADSLSVIYFI